MWFNLENRACLAAIDALAADAGRATLERLRAAERERDEARARFDALAEIDAIGKAAEIAAERER